MSLSSPYKVVRSYAQAGISPAPDDRHRAQVRQIVTRIWDLDPVVMCNKCTQSRNGDPKYIRVRDQVWKLLEGDTTSTLCKGCAKSLQGNRELRYRLEPNYQTLHQAMIFNAHRFGYGKRCTLKYKRIDPQPQIKTLTLEYVHLNGRYGKHVQVVDPKPSIARSTYPESSIEYEITKKVTLGPIQPDPYSPHISQ